MQSFSLIVIRWIVIYPVACITGEIHMFCGFREGEGKSEAGEEHQTRAALAFVRLKNARATMLVMQAILSLCPDISNLVPRAFPLKNGWGHRFYEKLFFKYWFPVAQPRVI